MDPDKNKQQHYPPPPPPNFPSINTNNVFPPPNFISPPSNPQNMNSLVYSSMPPPSNPPPPGNPPCQQYGSIVPPTTSYNAVPPPTYTSNPPPLYNSMPPPINPPLYASNPPPSSFTSMPPPPSFTSMPPPPSYGSRPPLSIVPPNSFPATDSTGITGYSRPPLAYNSNNNFSLTNPSPRSNSNNNLITISTASPPPTPVSEHGSYPNPNPNYLTSGDARPPQSFPNIGTPAPLPPKPLPLPTPNNTNNNSNNINNPPSVNSSPPAKAMGSRKSSTRIDPAQMPRPPFVNSQDLDLHSLDILNYPTRSGSGRRNPPSCNSPYSAIDTGNATPRHIRVTLVAPPVSQDICSNVVGLPLSMCATPFAAAELGEDPICAVPCDSNSDSPIRCSRCKGYVNPSVTWTDGGNKWECNLCFMSNPVSPDYYSPLDNAGLRADRLSRAELQLGSYDFLVNQDYCVRPPQAPVFVFAIDCSLRAHVTGTTAASIKAVLSAIKQLRSILNTSPSNSPSAMSKMSMKRLSLDTGGYYPQDSSSVLYDDIRVAVFTFSAKQIQFYKVEAGSNNEVKVLVTDSDDPFCPLPENQLLIPLQSPILDLFMEKLPSLIVNPLMSNDFVNDAVLLSESSEGKGDSCPTAAIKSMQEGLSKVGGRLYIMTSTHATNGYGKVPGQREVPFSVYGQGDKEFAMYCSPSVNKKDELSELYDKLAGDCLLSNLCVNIFMCAVDTDSIHFADTALIGEPALRTGGKLFFLTGNMNLENNVNRLEQQLLHDIDNISGCEVVVKVRTGVGMQLDTYIGPGSFSELRGEVEMSGISKDTSFLFTFKYDTTLKDEDKVHFQLAVLYTTPFFKQRVIRVHNMALIASVKPSTIFRNTDIEAVTTTLMKQALHRALYTSMTSDDKNNPKTSLNKNVIDTLFKYRINCSANSPRGQLILPESLKVLPVYTLGMLKHYSLVENRPCTPGTPSRPNSSSNGFPQSNKSPIGTPTSIYKSVMENIIPKITVRGNERSHEIRKLLSLSVKEVINSIYPRMYSLLKICSNEVDESESEYEEFSDSNASSPQISPIQKESPQRPFFFGKSVDSFDKRSVENSQPHIPACKRKELVQLLSSVNPSSEVFDSDQIYVLDDRTYLWIYVGRSVPQPVVEEVFEIDSSRPYDRNEYMSINQNTFIGKKVSAFLELLRSSSAYKQEIKIIWAEQSGNSPLLNRFSIRLVEDSMFGLMSYVDFLCNMHTIIQERIPQ